MRPHSRNLFIIYDAFSKQDLIRNLFKQLLRIYMYIYSWSGLFLKKSSIESQFGWVITGIKCLSNNVLRHL